MDFLFIQKFISLSFDFERTWRRLFQKRIMI